MYPIQHFERAVRRWPDCPAAEFGDQVLTYSELGARVAALAAGLQSLDPDPGSRVAICAHNSLENLIAMLAIMAAGKVWVPLQYTNPEKDILNVIEITQASIVIAHADLVPKVASAGGKLLVCDGPDAENSTRALMHAHAGKRPAPVSLPLNAPQAIKFTGGTTGRPKGVMQSYRGWNTNIVTQIVSWKMREGDRYLAAAPITHGASTYLMPTFAIGGTVVLLDRPAPSATLDCLQNREIAHTFLAPTVIYMMMELPEARNADYAALRNLIYGGGPMRPDAIARAQEIFGERIGSTYGQTEASQVATMISPSELARPELRQSVGRDTLLTQVEIMAPDGSLMPPGEIGEIVIRGDLLMEGYLGQPDLTAQTIVDGWLHTGDLGCKDDLGYLSIRGRTSEMIITGGFNVYPSEVEPSLGQFPGVVDCAVFGVPDEKWGEAVHAAVQMQEGAAADPGEIIAFLRTRLGPVKTPKSVRFYDRMPRNAFGKIQRKQLVADSQAEQAAGVNG
ncbi:long-chain fatty acid--CoA ligase [Martelella lutilitoris]|uniref:Long-chain fatty acid--CoA ligase n=1 Tax=Martelella lutilitoris TaxID=2583532 RepID=A0A5C4JT02_9HYPH|nr:AMP-binding protein [Martelella lutilitoris]TNB47779.1 long-chain fatty acid--CoA ligase [Martelella lutilitoris]